MYQKIPLELPLGHLQTLQLTIKSSETPEIPYSTSNSCKSTVNARKVDLSSVFKLQTPQTEPLCCPLKSASPHNDPSIANGTSK